MEFNPINSIINNTTKTAVNNNNVDQSNFSQFLQTAMQNLNNDIIAAEKQGEVVASGNLENIHNLKIANEQAYLELQLATQIRNKIIEAYQEIMRMQI